MSETESKAWRLKKASDGMVIGPIDGTRLKELAEGALVAPEDMIDCGDDNWKYAPEIEFLEMVWIIETKSGQTYGPTTVGTVRDFFGQGDLTLDDDVVHVHSAERKKIGDLLHIDLDAPAVLGETDENSPSGSLGTKVGKPVDETVVKNLELAKDLRIRQLEADLAKAHAENEQLLAKYTKAIEEIKALKGR
ncbi:MAG: hypothetical protein OHK005_07080 [Candidatus Methylacidiphilales bacterium]